MFVQLDGRDFACFLLLIIDVAGNMKSIILLNSDRQTAIEVSPNSFRSEQFQIFDGTFDFSNLISNFPDKVKSVIEISGETRIAALSKHCKYLAILERFEANYDILHIIFLKEKRIKAFRKFLQLCSFLNFHAAWENFLFVGSTNGYLHLLDIETELWIDLESHEYCPSGISCKTNSDILLSWSKSEVLTWLWPSCVLTKKLRINYNGNVIVAGQVDENQIFAAFSSGTVMLWQLNDSSYKQSIIESPNGIEMQYTSFSISLDNVWLVGVGSQPMFVIYSLSSLRVYEVVHLPATGLFSALNHVIFLPVIHPQFSKSLLLATSSNVIISDFTTSTIIKTLKSQHYPISNVCVSGDGILLCVTYSNGTTKVYALPSFYPQFQNELKKSDELTSEVKFKVLQHEPKFNEQKRVQREKIESLLDSSKWIQILEEFEEFPEKYRKFIWTSLLKLPRNFSIFSNLLRKEENNTFKNLNVLFPNSSRTLLKTLDNTLRCLCIWTPALSAIKVLPNLIFPFVELFEDNALLCFEVSATLISNWFRPWIEQWPAAPSCLLGIEEQLICNFDPSLWLYLQNIKATPLHYIYPLIYTSLSKILAKKDWCNIWDQILSKPPSFLLCVLAAFVLSLRQSLLLCEDCSHIEDLLCKESWLSAKQIIKRSKKLYLSLEIETKERENLDSITYIPKGDLIPLNWKAAKNTKDSILPAIFSKLNVNENGCERPSLNRSVSQCNRTSSSEGSLRRHVDPNSETLSTLNYEEVKMRGNDCLKRANNIRKKQLIKFTT